MVGPHAKQRWAASGAARTCSGAEPCGPGRGGMAQGKHAGPGTAQAAREEGSRVAETAGRRGANPRERASVHKGGGHGSAENGPTMALR